MSKSQSHDDVSQSKALLGDAEPYSAPLNDAGGGRKTTKSSSRTRNGKPALWPSFPVATAQSGYQWVRDSKPWWLFVMDR